MPLLNKETLSAIHSLFKKLVRALRDSRFINEAPSLEKRTVPTNTLTPLAKIDTEYFFLSLRRHLRPIILR
jgi:hypothetical protein